MMGVTRVQKQEDWTLRDPIGQDQNLDQGVYPSQGSRHEKNEVAIMWHQSHANSLENTPSLRNQYSSLG